MTRQRNPQNYIASIMEDISPQLNSPSMTQNGFDESDDESMIKIVQSEGQPTDDPDGFTAEELKIAKRFVELMGGADRAREVLDKVDECLDCLDLVDDDTDRIESIADSMPALPDLPTSIGNVMNLSTLYNPNATTGIM